MFCPSLASAWGLLALGYWHIFIGQTKGMCAEHPSDGKVCVSGYKIRLSSILSVLLPQERCVWETSIFSNHNVNQRLLSAVWVQVERAALLCVPQAGSDLTPAFLTLHPFPECASSC